RGGVDLDAVQLFREVAAGIQPAEPVYGGKEERCIAAGRLEHDFVARPDGPVGDEARKLRRREEGAARLAECRCVHSLPSKTTPGFNAAPRPEAFFGHV